MIFNFFSYSPNIHVFIIENKDMASVFYCGISYMATKLLYALYNYTDIQSDVTYWLKNKHFCDVVTTL